MVGSNPENTGACTDDARLGATSSLRDSQAHDPSGPGARSTRRSRRTQPAPCSREVATQLLDLCNCSQGALRVTVKDKQLAISRVPTPCLASEFASACAGQLR